MPLYNELIPIFGLKILEYSLRKKNFCFVNLKKKLTLTKSLNKRNRIHSIYFKNYP